MDSLFEASFSHTTTEAIPYSKCGRCARYLKLVGATGKIQRLYCPTEELVYELPIGGMFKQYNGRTCALCGFELLVFTVKGTSRSFPLCPFCFNHPPLEGSPRVKALLRGAPHPIAHPVVDALTTSKCPECGPEKGGVLVLDPNRGTPVKLHCAQCDVLVRLPQEIRRAAVSEDAECAVCDAKCLELEYFDGENRLACLACEDELNENIRVVRTSRAAGGRTFGGRGRGGRGGRGRRDD